MVAMIFCEAISITLSPEVDVAPAGTGQVLFPLAGHTGTGRSPGPAGCAGPGRTSDPLTSPAALRTGDVLTVDIT